MTDCLTGSDYPAELAWLPLRIVPIVGIVLAAAGVLVSVVLTRCHFGLVVNGAKMEKVATGVFAPQPLNWLGVTTNFVALTALSAGAGLSLLLAAVGAGFVAWLGGAALIVLLMLFLRVSHWRANRLAQRLEGSWQHGEVARELGEEHARMSLDAATSDIAVVVTMAAALFAGVFNSMTNVGGIPDRLDPGIALDAVKAWGVPALSTFTLVSLLLTGRMVVRLRIALGDYSARLAELRDEPDDPWRFRWLERSFLLFLLVQVLAGAAATIVVWHLAGGTAGAVAGGAVLLAGVAWYPVVLRTAARARRR